MWVLTALLAIFSFGLAIVLAAIVLILGYLFLATIKNKDYWPKKGVTYAGHEIIGNPINNIVWPQTVFDIDVKLLAYCKRHNVKYIGGHEFFTPFFFCRDLDIIKRVLVKDFDYFVNRRNLPFHDTDPYFCKMLFNMEGNNWKNLRAKMTSTFTTGKIKRMFKIFDISAKKFSEFLADEISPAKSKDCEMTTMFGKFTIDVIATTAFGIDSRPFEKKHTIFEEMGERMQLKICFATMIKAILINTSPKISKVFNLSLTDLDAYKFIEGTMTSVMDQRKTQSKDVKRDDFLQILMEAREGKIEKVDESEMDTFEKEAMLKVEDTSNKIVIDDEGFIAQCMLFMLAGFDSVRSFLIFAAYQLAVCPDIQEKLAKEVQEVWKKGNGEFTYEAIYNMEYLDKFTSETLRMYPPAPRVDRRCEKAFTIPDTDITIEKDTLFYIPIFAIHHDADHYPDPEKFDPERFTAENKAKRHPYSYLPFGHGPRNCIAMRFALAESKLCVAHFVRSFVIEPCAKTLIPMRFGFEGTIKSADGMWLNLKKRNWPEL